METLKKHPFTAKYQTILNKLCLNSPLRLAHFMGQLDHESGLKPKRENLNYSVDGLLNNFGRHRISRIDAMLYGRSVGNAANQRMIANTIYGGKWGAENLGNIKLNDGWNFRGGGMIQLTGRSNYERAGKDLGIDFKNHPELIENEADSLLAAIWFWEKNNCSYYADRNDAVSVSKIINLGSAKSKGTPKGLDDRIRKTNMYLKLFA